MTRADRVLEELDNGRVKKDTALALVDRVRELEAAIRKHKNRICVTPALAAPEDWDLWGEVNDGG